MSRMTAVLRYLECQSYEQRHLDKLHVLIHQKAWLEC
jgi:hypothetical protein